MAYHPGGAGLTVVDLDNAAAIAWARATLPATRTVPTTRGEHWIYRGAMPSANAVRPGVDIKSTMSYARWLGPGTGTMTALPDAVRALTVKEPAPARPASVVAVPAPAGGGECPHRTPTYLERGIAMAEQRIAEARERGARDRVPDVPRRAVDARPVRLPHRRPHRAAVHRRAGQGRDRPGTAPTHGPTP